MRGMGAEAPPAPVFVTKEYFMFKNNITARSYQVLKEFVFRGVQYVPGSTFDPVDAQCPPIRLATLVRQRILGEDGIDLPQALQGAQEPPQTQNSGTDGNSDGKSARPAKEPPAKKSAAKEAAPKASKRTSLRTS